MGIMKLKALTPLSHTVSSVSLSYILSKNHSYKLNSIKMSKLYQILTIIASYFMTINSFRFIGSTFNTKPIIASRWTMKASISPEFKIQSLVSKLAVAGVLSFSSLPYIAPVQAAVKGFYLTEPSSSFLEEEKRTDALRKQQTATRQSWDALVEEFTSAPVPPKREQALIKMKAFLKSIDTLPTGVKKLDLVKTCRAQKFNGKKVKPEWTKEVEIAYQALIQEWNRQANPKNPGDKTI